MVNVNRPGTTDPENQRSQVSSTWPILEANSAISGLAAIPVSEFPVVGPDGKVNFEPFYTVMGFAPTKNGLAILGRASQKQVVNVAQRGGMCAVMTGHPPSRLLGPG